MYLGSFNITRDKFWNLKEKCWVKYFFLLHIFGLLLIKINWVKLTKLLRIASYWKKHEMQISSLICVWHHLYVNLTYECRHKKHPHTGSGNIGHPKILEIWSYTPLSLIEILITRLSNMQSHIDTYFVTSNHF